LVGALVGGALVSALVGDTLGSALVSALRSALVNALVSAFVGALSWGRFGGGRCCERFSGGYFGERFGAGLSVQLPVPLGQPIKKNSRRYVSTPILSMKICRRQVGRERVAEGINPMRWIVVRIAPVLLEVGGHLA